MKFPNEAEECFKIDWVELAVDEVSEVDSRVDPLETAIVHPRAADYPAPLEYLQVLNAAPPFVHFRRQYESLEQADKPITRSKTSLEEPLVLELKQLPNNLKYSYLGQSSTLLVIVSASLDESQERSYYGCLGNSSLL